MNEMEVWLARDLSGQLYIHKQKPFKYLDHWKSRERMFCGMDEFFNIKWEDEEPTKAKIILNK